MPSQATITAKTGPNQQVTAKVFTGLTAFNLDIPRMVLSIAWDGGLEEFDLTGVTTITDTVSGSGSAHTIVVS